MLVAMLDGDQRLGHRGNRDGRGEVGKFTELLGVAFRIKKLRLCRVCRVFTVFVSTRMQRDDAISRRKVGS